MRDNGWWERDGHTQSGRSRMCHTVRKHAQRVSHMGGYLYVLVCSMLSN